MTKKKTDAEKKDTKQESTKQPEKTKHLDGPHEDTDGQGWERGESIKLAKDQTKPE